MCSSKVCWFTEKTKGLHIPRHFKSNSDIQTLKNMFKDTLC